MVFGGVDSLRYRGLESGMGRKLWDATVSNGMLR
jgi:hypothetical protein